MGYTRTFIERSWILLLPALVLILTVAVAKGQQSAGGSTQEPEQVATLGDVKPSSTASNAPVFTDYRGVTIGMSVDEVRSKLDRIKEGDGQDFLVLSDKESAQIYYDDKGKVIAVSIDYLDNAKAPTPESVLGTSLTAKENGSMYQLNRYPDAGYWVSFNRTSGDKPIVTITMQRM